MNYIDEIFARADIRQICEFLSSGTGEDEPDRRPFIERLQSADTHFHDQLAKEFPENPERVERLWNSMDDPTAVYEDVFMEIGLRIGFSLAVQINDILKQIPKKLDFCCGTICKEKR